MFRELEKAGKISFIEMRRIEFRRSLSEQPKNLHDSAEVVEMDFEEPAVDRPPAVKSWKRGKDVKVLSKSLRRLHLTKDQCLHNATDSDNFSVKTGVSGQGACSDTNVAVNCTGEEELKNSLEEIERECDEKSVGENDETFEWKDTEGLLEEISKTVGDVKDEAIEVDLSKDLASNSIEVDTMDSRKGPELIVPCLDAAIKTEDDDVENFNDDAISLRHSRSPSICSLVSEDHTADVWGRNWKEDVDEMEATNEKEATNAEEVFSEKDVTNEKVVANVGVTDERDKREACDERETCLERETVKGNVDDSSLIGEEWVEIESICASDNEAEPGNDAKTEFARDVVVDSKIEKDALLGSLPKDENANETVKAWLDGRKKFFRNSKNSHFHEYVVDNMIPKNGRPSLSQSLLSLDSAFSSSSALSLSSISKDQRQISLLSGSFGYGNFDKYNTEYLSKLRAERLATRRRLKPYDVRNSRRVRARPVLDSCKDTRDDCSWRSSSKTVVYMEEEVTRRTYARNSMQSQEKRRRFHSVTDANFYGHGSEGRRRVISESGFRNKDISAGSTCFSGRSVRRRADSFPAGHSHSSLSSVRGCNMKNALRNSSLPKESLYELWQRRRDQYMKTRYGSTMSLTGYTCGLCFKSFETRTRREQHSDELMHWACITCGRFFSSHTALSQHVEQVGHRKD